MTGKCYLELYNIYPEWPSRVNFGNIKILNGKNASFNITISLYGGPAWKFFIIKTQEASEMLV